jgi:hypothetical protein
VEAAEAPVGRAETGEPVTQLRLRSDVVLLIPPALDVLGGNPLASRGVVTASRRGRST